MTDSIQVHCKTQRPASVRIAAPADYERLLELGIEAQKDNAPASASLEKMKEWAAVGTARDGRHVVGVIDGPNGTLDGCIALVIGQPWYSDDWVIEDKMVFVRASRRASNHARDLINFAKWYAELLRLPLYMAVFPKYKWALKSLFFDRFLPRAGSFYLYTGGVE